MAKVIVNFGNETVIFYDDSQKSLKTVSDNFRGAFYAAYWKKRRKKNNVNLKREAEHLKYVFFKEVENSSKMLSSSEYRRLQRSCKHWTCNLLKYGLMNKKLIKRFKSFVNEIKDLDESYHFGEDDKNYDGYNSYSYSNDFSDNDSSNESENNDYDGNSHHYTNSSRDESDNADQDDDHSNCDDSDNVSYFENKDDNNDDGHDDYEDDNMMMIKKMMMTMMKIMRKMTLQMIILISHISQIETEMLIIAMIMILISHIS